MEKNTSGVYLLKNMVNQKIYVGSAENIKSRWNRHRYQLRRGKHRNNHFQASYNKHGGENFYFIIQEYCTKENLLNRETYWVNFYNTLDPTKGYNCVLPNDLKVIRPKKYQPKGTFKKYICINKATKEKLELTSFEIKLQLGIPFNKMSKALYYWRDAKDSRMTHKGWIFVHPDDYDESFDYINFDGHAEYWKNYIPKPKLSRKKLPEDIIPYSERNINRKPILLKSITTGEEFKYDSVSLAISSNNLIGRKVSKCLSSEFGKYKHHGFHFKYL